MWRIQVLDDKHLVIQYGSGPLLLKNREEESPCTLLGAVAATQRCTPFHPLLTDPFFFSAVRRSLEAQGMLVYFVFYNFVDGQIVTVYDNDTDDLLELVCGDLWQEDGKGALATPPFLGPPTPYRVLLSFPAVRALLDLFSAIAVYFTAAGVPHPRQ
jgi:hypothetical protein